MTLSVTNNQWTANTSKIMPQELALQSYRTIQQARCKGGCLIFVSVFIFMIACAVLFLGALFLGTPENFSNVLLEVGLTMILPSLLAIFLISAPLFMHGLLYDHISRVEHKKIASSHYEQLCKFCQKQQQGSIFPSKKDIVLFIENQMLLSDYTRVFSSISLSQTIILAQTIKKLPSKQQQILIDALETAKTRLFMSDAKKRKQEKKMSQET